MKYEDNTFESLTAINTAMSATVEALIEGKVTPKIAYEQANQKLSNSLSALNKANQQYLIQCQGQNIHLSDLDSIIIQGRLKNMKEYQKLKSNKKHAKRLK